MRAKSRWFRVQAQRAPEEAAGVVAFIAFRAARHVLDRMRRAGFDIDAGPAYFDFLAEALAFAIQCACRLAWPRLAAGDQERFASALAHRAAAHLADNEAELLGARSEAEVRERFIALLNRRFQEYAELEYGEEPSFAFLRYFASLVAETVPEKDQRWTYDQVIALEGPEIAGTLARSVANLFQDAAA